MIRFESVRRTFDGGRTVAVDDVSLDVARGETLVLVGSSGCGKTTLLGMVNRLVDPDGGRVLLDGAPVADADPVDLRRSIGYVFQEGGLLPHLTALENAALVPRLLGWSRERRRERAAELLECVGLEPDLHGRRFPDELSGGQCQRIGVARALAMDPAVLLMDEPFGALDAITRDRLQGEIAAITRRQGCTVLFVTHDILEAFRLGDRVAVMHEGRLEQVAAPAELRRAPATDFVRDLVSGPLDALRRIEGADA